MKKPLRLGLVVEGRLTESSVLRCPSVLALLGPVKAKSPRLAKRAVNLLGAGESVNDFAAFEETDVVLIHVPEESLSATVADLCAGSLQHERRTYVACETWHSSAVLRPLSERGACTATSVTIPAVPSAWVALEGDASAARSMRSLLEGGEERTVTIGADQKHLLFAAELLAGVFPIALFARAEKALRSADLSGRHLRMMLDGIGRRMLLDAAHTAHPAARSALRECRDDIAKQHLGHVASARPDLAAFLETQMSSIRVEELLPGFKECS